MGQELALALVTTTHVHKAMFLRRGSRWPRWYRSQWKQMGPVYPKEGLKARRFWLHTRSVLMNFKQEGSLGQFAAMSRYGKLKCFLPFVRILTFYRVFFPPILFQILIIQAFINTGQQIIIKIFAFRIKRLTVVWFQLLIITWGHMFYLWIKYER